MYNDRTDIGLGQKILFSQNSKDVCPEEAHISRKHCKES